MFLGGIESGQRMKWVNKKRGDVHHSFISDKFIVALLTHFIPMCQQKWNIGLKLHKVFILISSCNTGNSLGKQEAI